MPISKLNLAGPLPPWPPEAISPTMESARQQQESAAWGDLDWGALEPATKSEESAQTPYTPEVEVAGIAPAHAREAPGAAPAARLPAESSRHSSPSDPLPAALPRTVSLPQSTSTAPGGADSRASVATLTLAAPDGKETIATVRGEFTIGRKSENDLSIKDLHVSGRHAKLVCLQDGAYELHDLGSSGGTMVNGEKIASCRLASGDEIEFATVPAVFHYAAGPMFEQEMELAGTIVRAKKPPPAKLTQPRLTVFMPDGSSLLAEISRVITVGRAPENDVTIPESHVSSRHARLLRLSDSTVEIADLDSTCGTFVNDAEIKKMMLTGGEKIRFGVVEALLETPASAARQPPARK